MGGVFRAMVIFNAIFRIDQLTSSFVCLYLWTLNRSIFTVVFEKRSIFTVVLEKRSIFTAVFETLDIYRGFRKRAVFCVHKTRFARYLP